MLIFIIFIILQMTILLSIYPLLQMKKNKMASCFLVLILCFCTYLQNIYLIGLVDLFVFISFMTYYHRKKSMILKVVYTFSLLFVLFCLIQFFINNMVGYMVILPDVYMFEDIIIYNKVIMTIINCLVYYALAQIIIRPYNKWNDDFPVYAISYIVVPFMMVLSLVLIYFMVSQMNIGIYYFYSFIIAISLLIFLILFHRLVYKRLEIEKRNYLLELSQEKIDNQLLYYHKLKKSNDEMLFVLHDIKNHIHLLSTNTDEKDRYIDSLFEKFTSLKKICYTNDILNIFLQEKSLQCKEKDIECYFHIDRVDLSFIDDKDFITLLSVPYDYILQNQIISNQRCFLNIINHHHMLFINFLLENVCESEELEQEFQLTMDTLSKYDGSLSIKKTEKGLKIGILISIP